MRLRILRHGQTLVLRALPGSRSRQGASLNVPDWKRIDAAQADWSTLDYESLESFRTLLAMLFASGCNPADTSVSR